jgi:hypothetical protein
VKRIIALTLASLSLTIGLAGAAQAQPGQTSHAPPPLPTSTVNAEVSALTIKFAKLHIMRGAGLSARELKALGLRPVPKQLAARFKRLAHSGRARAATAGSTFWFTQFYYGQVWQDVYYSGPYSNAGAIPPGSGIGLFTYYLVYMNFKVCDPFQSHCIPTNVYTTVSNVNYDGTYYYQYNDGQSWPDTQGFPIFGDGPYSG